MIVVIFLGGHGQKLRLGSILAFTPELEMPVNEFAGEVVYDGVLDNDGPVANASFSPIFAESVKSRGSGRRVGILPVNDTHECPIIVAFGAFVWCTSHSQMADYLVGTDEIDTEVTAATVFDVHCDSDVLEALEVGFFDHVLGDLKAHGNALFTLRDILVDMYPWREQPGLRLDILPRLGRFNNSVAV